MLESFICTWVSKERWRDWHKDWNGIDKIVKIFQMREGKKLRSIDVLDICNIIGSIVVSGNVRRSAQIALGDPDDYLFLRLPFNR